MLSVNVCVSVCCVCVCVCVFACIDEYLCDDLSVLCMDLHNPSHLSQEGEDLIQLEAHESPVRVSLFHTHTHTHTHTHSHTHTLSHTHSHTHTHTNTSTP